VDLREIYCKYAMLVNLRELQWYRHHSLGLPFGTLVRPQDEKLATAMKRGAGLLNDIRHSLRRVDQQLAQRRKSLWWWLTLCRYQMMYFEYWQLMRRWQESQEPRPTFTPELSQARINQSADQIMIDACHRTTFDAYQLTRITEAHKYFLKLRGGPESPDILPYVESVLNWTVKRSRIAGAIQVVSFSCAWAT